MLDGPWQPINERYDVDFLPKRQSSVWTGNVTKSTKAAMPNKQAFPAHLLPGQSHENLAANIKYHVELLQNKNCIKPETMQEVCEFLDTNVNPEGAPCSLASKNPISAYCITATSHMKSGKKDKLLQEVRASAPQFQSIFDNVDTQVSAQSLSPV